MKKYILLIACAICWFVWGVDGVRAQSAAACSKNVYAPLPDSILKEQARMIAEEKAREEAKMRLYERPKFVLPDTVLNLLYHWREFEQAFTVMQEFIQSQPADTDPYFLMFLEEEYYARRRFVDSVNFDFYTQKRQEFVDRMLNEFPHRVETFILELDENSTDEDRLRVLSRMIEVDSNYLPAYEWRGEYWLEHKQMDKFCEDFRHLPTQISCRRPEFMRCK